MDQKVPNLNKINNTITIPSEVIPIFNFGIVESISKLNPSPTHLHIIGFGNLYGLFGVVIGSSNCDIVEDVSDC